MTQMLEFGDFVARDVCGGKQKMITGFIQAKAITRKVIMMKILVGNVKLLWLMPVMSLTKCRMKRGSIEE